VNGYTGAVSLTTTDIAEGTNEYFTTTRARAANSAGTGISYSGGVITNTAPDQNVSLTSGTGISATGTYPSFTITNTAPDQVVGLTGAGTTSISGTYPNFTITSNDQYVGTITSVSASLPISSTGGTTPNLSITQATTSTDGYLSSTDWNTFNNKVSSATLAGYVPYTGATTNVNLGTHTLSAANLVINHTSGSGVAASITKGGNGEALSVVKSSGSGNAASITGGVTLLSELNLTTDLADAYIASATIWNAKQNAITLTTTGNNGASTFVSNTLNIPTYTLAGLGGINLTSLSATSPLLYDNTTGVFSIQQASGSQAGFLSAADWTTFNGKQSALGYTPVPNTRTLTINGTAYDLSADRSWTITPNVNATNTQDYTATAGQTTFSVSGGYTIGQLAVYYNGSKLAAAEYTATNGTSFTLATACQANDIVQAVVEVTGGGIGGSGTTNYISKWTASGVLGDSGIYQTGTKFALNGTTITDSNMLNLIGDQSAVNVGLVFNNTNATYPKIYGIQNVNNNLVFYDYSANATRLILTSSGQIGVGTSSVDSSLSFDIQNASPTSNNVFLRIKNNFGSEDTGIKIAGTYGTPYEHTFGVNTIINSGDLIFHNSNTLGYRWYIDGTERMKISPSGVSAVTYTATDRFIATANAGYRVNNNTDGVLGYMLRSGLWKGDSENNLGFATDGAYGISFFTNGSVTPRLNIYYDGYIAMNSVVFGTTTSGTIRTLYIGNGANYLIGGISSVRRSKTNIENVSNVDWIYDLNPVTFNYRKADENKNYTDEFYEDLNYGLIAEDTAPVADFLINYNDKEDGTKEMIGIEYPRLIVPLLKAIQELKAEVDTLKQLVK
jgi:hypothetical protein